MISKTNSEDRVFLNIAEEIAKFSKCVSAQVGCVIVKEGRILSTGYNGTPKNVKNCCDHFIDYDKPTQRDEHGVWSQKFEIHAELNALIWAARTGIQIDGATLYCTLQPCMECTKNIIGAGIKKVVYDNRYDRIKNEDEIITFLKEANVEYYQCEFKRIYK